MKLLKSLFMAWMAFSMVLPTEMKKNKPKPTSKPKPKPLPKDPISKICKVTIPDDPLTEVGLSTPFYLNGCIMNQDEAVFAQAVIYDNVKQEFFEYTPLIVTASSQNVIPPIAPKFPDNSTVALWFGSNDFPVQLVNEIGISNGNCVDNVDGSLFGQFAHCNAIEFFQNTETFRKFPVNQIAADGGDCPTSRSWIVVDADPSDNLPTSYLALADGTVLSDTPENRKTFNGLFTILFNPSDEGLMNFFIQPALQCPVWKVQSLQSPTLKRSTLPTNELFAHFYEKQPALIPVGSPFSLLNGKPSLAKLNALRAGVGQPTLAFLDDASTRTFCDGMIKHGLARLKINKQRFSLVISPAPDIANDLFLFLSARLSNSFEALNCKKLLGTPNPVKLIRENGIVTNAILFS